MKNISGACLVAIATLALTSCASPRNGKITADTVVLELRPLKGQKIETTKTTSASVTATVMGISMDFFQRVTEKTRSVVTVANGDTLEVAETLAAISMIAKSDKQTIELDSTKPAEQNSSKARAMLSLVGETVKISLTRQGEILGITGVERLIERLKKDDELTDEAREDLDKLQQQYTQQGITALGRRLVRFPTQRLGVGDEWTDSPRAELDQFAVTVHEKWTLTERKNGVATLDVTMTLEIDPSSDVAQKYTAFSMDFSASAIGRIEVDEKTGWVLRSKLVLDMAAKRTDKTPDFMGDAIYKFTSESESVLK